MNMVTHKWILEAALFFRELQDKPSLSHGQSQTFQDISSKATPHEQSSSFGHGTSIKGAKGNLGWSPNPRILAFFFFEFKELYDPPCFPCFPILPKTESKLGKSCSSTGEKCEKRSPNIRNKLMTDHLHLPTAEKVTLRTPSQAKPGVETCSAETPWPSLATSCWKHPFLWSLPVGDDLYQPFMYIYVINIARLWLMGLPRCSLGIRVDTLKFPHGIVLRPKTSWKVGLLWCIAGPVHLPWPLQPQVNSFPSSSTAAEYPSCNGPLTFWSLPSGDLT